MRRLVATLTLLTGLHAADSSAIVIEAPPGTEIADDFVALYPNGFVARQGDLVLIGDALRHDLRDQLLYAEGRVVLVIPPLRIHAERLGIALTDQRGEAWGVKAWIDTGQGTLPISAERITFDRSEIRFEGLSSRKHGGVIGVDAGSVTIRLREEPAKDRGEPARYVRDITLRNMRLTAFNVPCFYLPWIKRDFTIDYPWSQVRFGSTERQGAYGVYQIGSALPEVGDLHSRLVGRVDAYSRSGFGIGGELTWKSDTLGRGSALWYGNDETIRSLDGDHAQLDERWQRVIDLEHRQDLGHGALGLRYTELPDRDPVDPATGQAAPIERFRNDYLREDLQERSFARQGAAIAYSWDFLGLMLDTERRPSDEILGADRLVGLFGVIPTTAVLGPLHADASGGLERMDDPTRDYRAWRMTGDATLRSLVWLGGLGFDASAGARALGYADRSLGGADLDDDPLAAYPYLEAGLRLRFEAEAAGWVHSLTPRVGLDLAGRARGDDLSGSSFGEPEDDLEDDHRWVVLGLDTALYRQREIFRLRADARFALRDEDRDGTDLNGQPVTSPDNLVGFLARATGRPLPSWSLFIDLEWDRIGERWEAFDVGTRWAPVTGFAVRYDGSYNPLPGVADPWEHRPGMEIAGSRYRIEGNLSLRPHGAGLDGWRAVLTRQAVDGRMGLSYEQYRDDEGNLLDSRIGFVVSY